MNPDDLSVLPVNVTSFYDYFKADADAHEVANAFGYTFESKQMTLPQIADTPDWEPELRERIFKWLPRIRMSNEGARRETMVAPLLLNIIERFDYYLLIEQWVNVAPQLKGRLDYILEADQSLLVVEAKDGDTYHGTTQLVAEMIALDKWNRTGERLLYGALTTGILWQFAAMNRETKTITQDLRSYNVPGQLDIVLRILIGILQDKPTHATT